MSKVLVGFAALVTVLIGIWAVYAFGAGALAAVVPIWLLVATSIGAWIASEFQSRRWLRLLLGIWALLMCFPVAFSVGMIAMFRANAWFGTATDRLIKATVSELEKGNVDTVVTELKELSSQYRPTYEDRARYDMLVEEAVSRMQSRHNGAGSK